MGILLLIVSVALGYCLIKNFIKISRPVMIFAGAFFVGCLVSGTVLYLFDLIFATTLKNYILGSIVYIVVALVYIPYSFIKNNLLEELKQDTLNFLRDKWALRLLVVFLAFSILLAYETLKPLDGKIELSGAWGDVAFHHSFVRSVAIGDNVPFQYPYYANSPMHYHFMFDYYSGKIAQMGIYSVHAYNLMFLLSLMFLLLLIFEFGRVYFNSGVAGALGAIMLMFHSSLSVFVWLNKNFNKDILSNIIHKEGWLEGAKFESWGLLNLNVFMTQRHLVFTSGILLFIVLYMVMSREDTSSEENNLNLSAMRRNIFIGVLIGMLPYWNVMVAGMAILFMGCFAISGIKNRNFFFGCLYSAVIAGIIAAPQILMFKSGDTALAEYPKLFIGYAVEKFAPLEILIYYTRVLGLKLVLIIASLFVIKGRKRLDFAILLIPFILTNVLQFGKVLYDNNKLIIMWIIFMNCFAAYVIVWLCRNMRSVLKVIPVLLFIPLILAGILDFISVINLNNCIINDNSPMKQWIVKNTKPGSVFLTNYFISFDDNAITTTCLAGGKLYVVRNNMDSSINVDERIDNVKRMYSFVQGVDKAKEMIKEEKIDYILVDDLVRNNKEYKVNEKEIANNYKLVYSDEKAKIYSVR